MNIINKTINKNAKAGRAVAHLGRINDTSTNFEAVELVPVPRSEMDKMIGEGRNNLADIKAESRLARIEVNDRGLELFGSAAQVRAVIMGRCGPQSRSLRWSRLYAVRWSRFFCSCGAILTPSVAKFHALHAASNSQCNARPAAASRNGM